MLAVSITSELRSVRQKIATNLRPFWVLERNSDSRRKEKMQRREEKGEGG